MVKRPRLVRILTVWQLTYLLWRYLPWNAAVWWHLVRQQFLRRLSIIASLTSSSLLWLSLMISRRYYCRLSDSCLCWTDHVREQERSAPGEVQTATDQPVPAYSYTGTHNTHLTHNIASLPHHCHSHNHQHPEILSTWQHVDRSNSSPVKNPSNYSRRPDLLT